MNKNDGCPDTVLGDCEPVCARCGRDMGQSYRTAVIERLREQALAIERVRALCSPIADLDPQLGYVLAADVLIALAPKVSRS